MEEDMESSTLKEKRDETVRRILDAAAEVFVEVGFAGARVDKIAERANVNKATIYYRVGDKKALYAEVLHDIFSDVADRMAHNIKGAQTPEEKMKNYILNIVNTVGKHPHFPRIMLWEIASGGRHFPQVVVKDFTHILGMLMEFLEEGVKKGVFVEMNPLILHLLIAGGTILYKTAESIGTKQDVANKLPEKWQKTISGDLAQEIEKVVLRAIKK
jgi:AcrR family transcriptional regulator